MLKRGIVELEEFNNEWFSEYEKEKSFLEEKLGVLAKEIHHVGSTSIEGLMAKPIIDILIVIDSLENISKVEEKLKGFGFSNRGHQGVEDRYFFAKGPEDARTHYIHFVEKNSNTYYNLVYFKKYLIEHPDYIKEYCNLKKELAKKYPADRKSYTKEKSDFISRVIKLAKEKYNKIIYVTGNWAKLASAKQVLEPLGFEIENIKMETIEIQNDNIEEVAKYSAKEASEKLKCDVLKNDSGLFVEALGGFPGPYTHYVDDKLGEDKLLKLLENEENRSAYFIEALAYCPYGQEPIVFTSVTKGTIAKEKSGSYGWSWDFIFIPEGKDKTLANFPDEERFKLWNNDAYLKLAEYLNNK